MTSIRHLAPAVLAALLAPAAALAQPATPEPTGRGSNMAPDPAGAAGTSGTTSTTTQGTPAPAGSSSPATRDGGMGSSTGNSGMGSSMGSGMGASGTGSAYGSGQGWSILPYTTGGYVGLSIGRPEYDTACGLGGTCDDGDTSFKIVTGGMVNPYLGLELGYLHFGDADRAGGTARAQGINLSAVGRVPLTQALGIFGKVGTTYGRTKLTSSALSGVAQGKESGWGLSYGIGASWDFNRNVSAVLEWERHDFQFEGQGREPVSATSLGLLYRF